MNAQSKDPMQLLRGVRAPVAPDLDVDAIMDAVRREAAFRPLCRPQPEPLGSVPAWLCGAAAALAVWMAGSAALNSVGAADLQIGHAWMRSVQPEHFAQSFMGDSSL